MDAKGVIERIALGKKAEDEAERLYLARNAVVLARNYRRKSGELDLIVEEGRELVFVEVRARTPGGWVGALESVDWRKRARIERTARQYLAAYRGACTSIRFDIVEWNGRGLSLIENAWSA